MTPSVTTDLSPLPVSVAGQAGDLPTVWGLNPIELHDYFWAARGVCVVRLGEERGNTARIETLRATIISMRTSR